ncbi:MAG: hypothetical protein ACOZQL_25580 [Myxococcota bacterium]
MKTNVPGWSLVGEGYQLRCDEVSTNCGVMILRSEAWTQTKAGALVHGEDAKPWRGRRFDFSTELRAGAVSQRAHVVLVAQDAQGKTLALAKSAVLEGTTSFSRHEVSLDVPENAEKLVVGIELIGSGAVFVRDLTVVAAR